MMKKIQVSRRQFRQAMLAIALMLTGLAVSIAVRKQPDRSADEEDSLSVQQEESLADPQTDGGASVSSGSSSPDGTLSKSTAPESSDEASSAEENTSTVRMVGVHVTGEVMQPDQVFYLPEGSRIADAIEMAGGATLEADLSRLNLAEYLQDGERITVPAKGEDIEEQSIITPSESSPQASSGSGAEPSGEGSSGLTNINSAGKIELMKLPGIGEAVADRIIEYREQSGGFSSIEEIMNVSGIGESKFDAIKALICI